MYYQLLLFPLSGYFVLPDNIRTIREDELKFSHVPFPKWNLRNYMGKLISQANYRTICWLEEQKLLEWRKRVNGWK